MHPMMTRMFVEERAGREERGRERMRGREKSLSESD
jgi:hypothetical protein